MKVTKRCAVDARVVQLETSALFHHHLYANMSRGEGRSASLTTRGVLKADHAEQQEQSNCYNCRKQQRAETAQPI